MITNKHFRSVLIVMGIAFLASCQKGMDQLPQDLDQATLRSVNFSLSPKAALGRKIYFDKRFSSTGMQSCSSCHLPDQGFVGKGTVNSVTTPGFLFGIGEGAVKGRFGGRKPPMAAYATFTPPFNYDPFLLEFGGGLFWDGRATGNVTGSPAGDQAIGPFLAPPEHNLSAQEDVLHIIESDPAYQALWKAAWGAELVVNPTPGSAANTQNYYNVGRSIAAYEASPEVNQFSSKFDAWLRAGAPGNGGGILNGREMAGMTLFRSVKCDGCHSMVTPLGAPAPLFTDFLFDNIGLPSNMDFINATGGNAPARADAGLYARLISDGSASSYPIQVLAGTEGLFRTPSLRNIAKGESNKRYMHNGVFKTLQEVVHFYNTRDVDPQFVGMNEFPLTMSNKLGNLKLTADQELLIVEFLRTLSDGYSKPVVTAQQRAL